ncbi:TonB-dependent receptor [Marinibactrum halimedae]|uniref:TonB-dependent receptor n=2 Tax=Marinibactrum halimedae TaxID=1444977 RepID=A0AA37T5U5_9GAMM|nr:TonB-dependent receptor [Marinibactrum halimedae]
MLSTPMMSIAQESEQEEVMEEIQVTGSLIRRENLVSTSPVTQVDAQQFKFQGITRVEDLLNDQPAIYPGQTSGQANGATGTATVDLRNLGTERTLVLVNNRRLPAGSPVADGIGADINQIPGALIERVDILTGGASSTYGSDAVAGVVNFIMKTDFEGIQVDVQASGYQHDNDNGMVQSLLEESNFDYPSGSINDGDSYDISLVGGMNFDNGRGNITTYYTYRDIEAVRQDDRDFSTCALGGVEGNYSCGGSATTDRGTFGNLNDVDLMVEGNQFVNRNGYLFNFAPDNFFQRPDERTTAGLFANYEINDKVKAYTEIMYMSNESNAQIAPSGAFFITDTFYCGNPFMSDQQYNALCGALEYGRDEYSDDGDILIGRRNVEGGARNNDLEHESLRTLFGFKGNINESWSYDIFAQYSEVEFYEAYNNDLSKIRVNRALDARLDENNNVVCASTLGPNPEDPDCVAWNIFEAGAVTQDMLEYLYLDLEAEGNTELSVFGATFSGDLGEYGMTLPQANNGVAVAFGLEYREESLDYNAGPGYESGDGAGQGGPRPSVEGEYDVTDVYFQALIPIMEGQPFAEELTLDIGYRFSDYSTSITTDTYKVAFGWAPNSDVKIRGSYNRAVRHANIRELFRPQAISLYDMDADPCGGPTPQRTLEECRRTGVTSAQYGAIANNPAEQYNDISGGEPDLKPETSDAYSFGIVYTPSQLPGLDLTLDYFEIEVTDAIDALTPQFILEQCLSSGAPEYCSLVNRDPGNGSLWTGTGSVTAVDQNIGMFRTEGIDVAINFDLELGDLGALRFTNTSTYIMDWERQEVSERPVIDCNGKWGESCEDPVIDFQNNFRVTWLTPMNLSINTQWRHMSEVEDVLDRADFDAQNYLDLSGIWSINDMVSIRAGINNITDREPPIGPSPGAGIFGNGNTFPGTYDALGRYWFLGATFNF